MEAHCEGGQSPPRAVMPRKEGFFFLQQTIFKMVMQTILLPSDVSFVPFSSCLH
jgi:hypothetical protein